ncbi:MAG: DUF2231 domain-containing protein [Bdellovibrionota bacterium]
MLKEILQGRFMRHPLHPLLVHLPVGLWICSLIMDIVFLTSGSASWATASFYTMGIGLAGVVLAVPAGLADYLDIPSNTRVKQIATTHMLMNFGVFALYVANLILRMGSQIVTGPELLISLASVALLGVSGYFGGLLVYQYGIGHRPERREPETLRRVA